MKIFVIDISGRNFAQYNPSLCRALQKNEKGNDIYLLSTSIKDDNPIYHAKELIRLVPSKFAGSENTFKRALRAVEVFINYIYIALLIAIIRPNIVHMQWLPLIEVCKTEFFFIKLFKRANNKLKVFMTVHNLYPHDTNKKESYKKNFLYVTSILDGFFVHLNSNRDALHNEFNIPLEKIFVSYHGIYQHEFIHNHTGKADEKIKIVLYGLQKWYKGADIHINALKLLPTEVLVKCSTTIVGLTEPDLYEKFSKDASRLNVTWINEYVSDDELNHIIDDSTLILLPYREISQSGVLLLALSYMKPILTSNLDSFKETLEGYPNDYFFESENAQSLANLLKRFILGYIDVERQIQIIKNLNKKYSWEETAKSTYDAYNKMI